MKSKLILLFAILIAYSCSDNNDDDSNSESEFITLTVNNVYQENPNNVRIVSDISIVPTWGIRRNIGSHFTYETGIGIGYLYYFAKDAGYAENESDVAVNLHLRIGYRF